AGAARAASRLSAEVGAPLLILRIAAGDPQPEVLGDCFRSLLEIAPDRHLALVARHMVDESEPVAEQAALALGDSRLAAALAPLRDMAERSTGARRKVLFVAMALLRQDAANAYLLGIVENAAAPTALAALEALAVQKHDPKVRDALDAAVAARDD